MMTGKYISYFPNLKKTFDQHFLTQEGDDTYQIHYFIFTDGKLEETEDVTAIPQKRLGWPFDSMMRFEIYFNASSLYSDMDYLYSVDADLQATRAILPETIIADLMGTRHPGYPNLSKARALPYDNHVASGSYIGDDEEGYYYFGAFWGGRKHHILQLCKTIRRRIRADLENDVIPAWHDESHLNRYFMDIPPPITLQAGKKRFCLQLNSRLCKCRRRFASGFDTIEQGQTTND
jgi:histo-blood group ABO system transferase